MTTRLTDRREVTEFRRAAQAFCDEIDVISTRSARAAVLTLFPLLADFTAAAYRLPDIVNAPHTDGYIGYDRWWAVGGEIDRCFAEYGRYILLFDPYDREHSGVPVMSTLWDDLASIYGHLAPGLSAWSAADAAQRRGILRAWKNSYEADLSKHAVAALSAMQSLLYHHGFSDDDLFSDSEYVKVDPLDSEEMEKRLTRIRAMGVRPGQPGSCGPCFPEGGPGRGSPSA
ncbi:MAG: DUF5063 domain-containing protein [Lentisphaerae bacterium]|jgi:hypothetical protein|nr:DUF5063 domain-containing protein [Lentisphaerota bacterium]MBT4815095.1 DUF5063 domain-containing protein [Lentisphaerota bacterium]MBT5609812.1 DUF5063 domain-containing protein [Lentisphaerota bacterium]MBT7055130.1 DUF5063 domain-containing protein [Lentisphaerota bacterium]MBT7846302.1 DUF5063 domain-containing protein [Lentisphaerota bacterium]